MTKTLQERRKFDRERKRAQRARARLQGAPTPAAVQRAIVEAVGFALLTAPIRTEWRPADDWRPVNVTTIIDTAVEILTRRGLFDGPRSRAAVRAALAPRAEWRWPSNVPTTNPSRLDVEIGVTTSAAST